MDLNIKITSIEIMLILSPKQTYNIDFGLLGFI